MANFNININAVPNIPFVPTQYKIRQESCLTGVTGIPIGIVNDTNTPGINFIFSEYTGALGWKTLNISNITYTEPTFFNLAYNGATLTPNIDPDLIVQSINVLNVATNESIPLFFANYDNNLADRNASIGFDIEIIDTNDVSLGKVRVGIVFLYVECIPPSSKSPVITNSTVITSCSTTVEVTVKVPAESSRYVSKVVSDGFGSVTGTLPATITEDTTYTMTIEGSTSGVISEYSSVQLLVKEVATSSLFLGSKTINRNHSGNIC